jgi:hypothetical protein
MNEETRDQLSVLRGHLAEADAMVGFQNSDVGQKFFEILKRDYSDMVAAAVRESEKYAIACRTIEHLFALVGDTMNVGKEAQKELDRLSRGETDEGY